MSINGEEWSIKILQWQGILKIEDVKLSDEWKDAF